MSTSASYRTDPHYAMSAESSCDINRDIIGQSSDSDGDLDHTANTVKKCEIMIKQDKH